MKLANWGPGPAAVSAFFHWIMTLGTRPASTGHPAVARNLLQRIALHMVWNGATFFHAFHQMRTTNAAQSLRYLSSMASHIATAEKAIVYPALGSYWLAKSAHWQGVPPLDPLCEKAFKGIFNGEEMSLAALGPALDSYTRGEYEEQGKTYPLLTPTVLKPASKKTGHPLLVRTDQYAFVQPSRSPINLLTCMVYRTMAETGVDPDAEVWERVHREWRALCYENFYPEKRYTFAEAVMNMDPLKRARLVNAMKRMDRDGRNDITRCSVSVKWNEVLIRREGLGVKPRAIIQEHEDLIADATAEIHSVSDAMHTLWAPARVWEVPHEKGFSAPVVFVYASGYTSRQLDEAFAQMCHSDCTWYWMAGDDNLTWMRIPELAIDLIYEGDFSKYDSTQRKDALAADFEDMVSMGFDEWAVGLDCLGRQLPICGQNHHEARIAFYDRGPPWRRRDAGIGAALYHLWQHFAPRQKWVPHDTDRWAPRPGTGGAAIGFSAQVTSTHRDTRCHLSQRVVVLVLGRGDSVAPAPVDGSQVSQDVATPSRNLSARRSGNGVPQMRICSRFLPRVHSPRVPNPRCDGGEDAAAWRAQRCRSGAQTHADTRRQVSRPTRPRASYAQDGAPVWYLPRGDPRSGSGNRAGAFATMLSAWLLSDAEVDPRLLVTEDASAGDNGAETKNFLMSQPQHKPRNNNHNVMPNVQPNRSSLQVVRNDQPQRLRPGDEVRDEHGNLLFKVDPQKAAKAFSEARRANRRQNAGRLLPPPKKSTRTKSAMEQLERKRRNKPRARGVVKHDFGLGTRAERVAKRTRVLHKRTRARRERRARRAAARDKVLSDEWDAHMASQTGGETAEVGSTGPGESWWGPILDSALELAPHVIPLVAGMGDYETEDLTNQVLPKTNSLAAAFSDGEMCCEVPAIHNLGNETRFSHREYIGDVYSSNAAFSRLDFAVNPGMNETFPWGSRSIINYEQYQMLGAMFVFETEASGYVGSPGLGYVALGSQYDVAEPVFASKKEMFQSQFSVARAPDETFCHWVECDPAVLVLPKKFTRAGAVPTNSDIHLYDHCRTSLAVGGQLTPGVIIGELWLTYDVLAFLPRTDESLNAGGMYCVVTSTPATVTQLLPLGTGWSTGTRNTFQVGISSTQIFFPVGMPEGDYLLIERWSGAPATVDYVIPVPTVANGTRTTVADYGIGYTLGGVGTYGPTQMGRQSVVNVNAQGQTILTYPTTTLVTPAGATFQATIVQIPKLPAQSSPIFDPQGRESQSRYEAMMKTLQGEADATPDRSTERYALRQGGRSGWILTDLANDKSRAIPEEEARFVASSTSDRLFDLAAAELMLSRGREAI